MFREDELEEIRDNLDLERWFRLPKSHERRIHGHRHVLYFGDEGRILDTIVHGLFTPLAHLPVAASAVGMLAAQTLIHIPVPSVSGQAVLTIPILVPVSDLLGLPKWVFAAIGLAVGCYFMAAWGARGCSVATPR